MHLSPPLRKTFVAIVGTILLLAILGFSGCDSTPAERVAAVKKRVSQAAAVNQTVDVAIADVEKIIANAQAALQDPNIPSEMKADLEKVLAEASAKLAKLKAEKQKATAIITRWQAFLAEVDPNNLTPEQELQLYATGAGEVSKFLPPPYNKYVYMGSTLVTILSTLLISIAKIKKKNLQINQGKTILTDVVTSVDALLASDIVKDTKEAKEVLQSSQHPKTRIMVDDIHDPLKNTGPSK